MILRSRIIIPFILFTLAFPFLSRAQKLKKNDKVTLTNLQTHIQYLSDDKLEGRRTGSAGERTAGEYISMAFSHAGLQPKGDKSGWLQAFDIDEGRQVSADCYFSVNNSNLTLFTEYFPLAFSASSALTGSPAIALQESGDPWFLDLKELLEAHPGDAHFNLEEAIAVKATAFAKKGATAMIVYNSSRQPDHLAFDPHNRPKPLSIPVLYITKEAKRKYLKDDDASVDIKIKVGFSEKKRTGHNVIGYLDNGAATTVIIGAHYDADDNASGVAGCIELARMLATSRLKGNNYLFIAFSGAIERSEDRERVLNGVQDEVPGLYGSKYFAEHPTIELKKVNYMINMDMIGRLSDSSHALTIGGYGTSPSWAEAGNRVGAADRKPLSLHFDSSGTGLSDHTAFYRKDIPVLFFFTGTHSDYRRLTDDVDKINYTGELQVLKYVYDIIENLDKKGRIAFARTRENTTAEEAPRFNVVLGIQPDYTFTGSGIRADAINDGKPASKAGLRAGDVIVQLGEYPVPTLEKYMAALNKFRKGDTTTVKYRRGSDVKEVAVQF